MLTLKDEVVPRVSQTLNNKRRLVTRIFLRNTNQKRYNQKQEKP